MPPGTRAAARSCADRLDTVPGESAVSPLSLSPPGTAEAPSKPSVADVGDHTREVASRQPVVSGRWHRGERCHRPGLPAVEAPPRDQVRTTALPGLAGTIAMPASSALIVRARAFRAWLEPLIPSLRRARLDTGLPAAVSLLAATRAWPMPDGIAVAALGAEHVGQRGPHGSLAYPELLQLGRSRSGDSTHGRDTAWRPQADF